MDEYQKIAEMLFPNNAAAQQQFVQMMQVNARSGDVGAGVLGSGVNAQLASQMFPDKPEAQKQALASLQGREGNGYFFNNSPAAPNLGDILGGGVGGGKKFPAFNISGSTPSPVSPTGGGSSFLDEPSKVDNSWFTNTGQMTEQELLDYAKASGLDVDMGENPSTILDKLKRNLSYDALKKKNFEGIPNNPDVTNTDQTPFLKKVGNEMLNDPSLYGGVGLENALFTAGKSFSFDPNNFSEEARGKARFGNRLRGVGAVGKSLLGIGSLVGAGMGYSKRMNSFMDDYQENQRKALVNNFRFENGGEMPHDERQRILQYLQNGGTVEDVPISQMLTGEVQAGLPKSQEGLANAELEKGEYVHSDVGVQKVVGDTHEKGGVKVSMEGGTRVVSDNLKLGKGYKECKEKYGIKVKATDTYAKAVDKYTKKLGLDKLNDEQEKLFKKLESQKDTNGESTKNLNTEYLSGRLNEIEQEKQPLLAKREEFTNYIYEKQEASKASESEGDKGKYKDGGEINTKSLASQYGISEKEMEKQLDEVAKEFGMSREKVLMQSQGLMKMKDGGELPKYEDGDPTIPAWVYKILDYENTRGSTSGTGVSNWGFTNPKGVGYEKFKSKEDAAKAFNKHFVSQVKDYPEELQPLLADYRFNTTRDIENLLAYSMDSDNPKMLEDIKLLKADKFNKKYSKELAAARKEMTSNPTLFKEKLVSARQNVAKSTKGGGRSYSLENPNPAYEKSWQGRIEMLSGLDSTSTTPTAADTTTPPPSVDTPAKYEAWRKEMNEFYSPEGYVHQKEVFPEQDVNIYGRVTAENLPARLEETLRIFPQAARFMEMDEKTGKPLDFKNDKAVGDFQTFVDNTYGNLLKYGDSESLGADFNEFVSGRRWDAGTPSKEFDKLAGNFSTSRSGVGLKLVTQSELEYLEGKGIDNFSEVFAGTELREDLDLSEETKSRLLNIKRKYGDEFEAFLMPSANPKKEPEVVPVIKKEETGEVVEKEEVKKETPTKPAEKETPLSIAEVRSMLDHPVLPPQVAMTPDGVQPHLMIDRTYQRLDPVELTDEEHLKEMFRQQAFASDQMDNIPDSQRRATMGAMTAATQAASNKVITDLAVQNAANIQQTEQFNIGQSNKEEDARAVDSLNFEQRQLTAKEKTLTDYHNYFKYNQDVRLGNFKTVQQMNFLSDLYDNFNITGNGKVAYDPSSAYEFMFTKPLK